MTNNTKAVSVVFCRRPHGAPVQSDFDLIECPIPDITAGEVLLQTRMISIDPYVRTMVEADNQYGTPLPLMTTIPGDIVGEVIASRAPECPVGSVVVGRLGWTTYAKATPSQLHPIGPLDVPLETHLSLFGSSGLTAFFGMHQIGKPTAGQSVLVSGAAGAVGNVACQLAKVCGAYVVGLAGGEAKRTFLRERIGVDRVIDHKSTLDLAAALGEAFPNGINVYFDNVGGPITHAALQHLANHARVVLCGESSQYNRAGREFNPRFTGPLMSQRASVHGFLVSDFADSYPKARREMAAMVKAGTLKSTIDTTVGIENAPHALIGMLRGDNTGKSIVVVK